MANILFSGGRGNKSLLQAITKDKSKSFTWKVVVNGLDDGASTGTIRELLGNTTHGISDFLKVALAMSPNIELQKLLEERLPTVNSFTDELKLSKEIYNFITDKNDLNCLKRYKNSPEIKDEIKAHMSFLLKDLYRRHGSIPNFSDFKIGNIVFASLLVQNKLHFQSSINDFFKFCTIDKTKFSILQSTETNSYLVGLLKSGSLLPNEAAVVLTRTSDSIERTFQISSPLSSNMIRNICSLELDDKIKILNALEVIPDVSKMTVDAISQASSIVYGAGTPYSSLLPTLELKGIANQIKSVDCPKILVVNLAKETSNTLSAKDVIDGIYKYLNKSNNNQKDLFDSRYLTHVIVPNTKTNNSTSKNLIKMDIDEIYQSYGWINIVQADVVSDHDSSKHDGVKLMNCIKSIVQNG